MTSTRPTSSDGTHPSGTGGANDTREDPAPTTLARRLRGSFGSVGGALLASAALLAAGACAVLSVPSDPQPACAVSTSTIEGWFESGLITLDGVVKPADSVLFPDVPNCDFYEWTEQMFLWLTSPAPPRYGGGGGRIFGSRSFFDVSPPDADGHRTFTRNAGGSFGLLTVRDAQRGAHGLPIVFDRKGQGLEVVDAVLSPRGRPLVKNAKGAQVEVHRASLGRDRRPVFLDEKGERIEGARPVLLESLRDARVVQRFRFDPDLLIFLGPAGNAVDVEQGQAFTGAVLMAQNGSLVYYRTTVNDVFAYYRSMFGASVPPTTRFPTTQGELDDIIDFAATHGTTLVDPEALAIEIKTAWIEAAGLPDPDRFITMQGTIPTYDMSNPAHWVRNGQKTTTLAMVAMHVVGSTAGHPEMLWGTFEHVSNTPNAAYSYTSSSGSATSVAQDTEGFWLFCSSGSSGPFNEPHMTFDSGTGDIVATAGHSISPSDTIRWKAWGKAHPSPSSNAQVISINNSVRGALDPADVRGNYVQTGTTWTINGAAPSGSNQVGTNLLCNTTMETYDQGSSNGNSGFNCFSCHATNTTAVSHVFGETQPLF